MAEMDKQEPIAIVGAACRLAGEVSSLGSLWDMISNVKTGHCKIPADRWDADVWHHPDPDRKGGISPRHGYFLQQNLGSFDAPFFSTTAKEAAALDPMKRLLLEVSYESFENAGIPVEKLMNSKTGCYVGCMTNDYEMMSLHDIYDVGHTAASATSEAMTANRVSWFFGMKGPSLTLDTACSSSLYALHLACQSLRTKETSMSLVAGVNLMIVPNTMHQLSAMHMLSPEGISHTFDDRANGYGRGEGIGALVVKRLSDAIRDGDTIRAVIRGTGVNSDGKTPSITQPSSTAQAEMIKDTYEAAGLDMADTLYFESHGTGTPVGDPIELKAIASTIGAARAASGRGPLYVGSIKPSVGHTEGCSGLAGVFKSILLLEQGKLVPTYGVERVNPALKLEDWNLELPNTVRNWPSRDLRRISVNSFGFGGANAHVIMDDAYHYLQDRRLSGKHATIAHPDDLSDTASDSGISSQGSAGYDDHESKSTRKLFAFSVKDKAGLARVSEKYATALDNSSSKAADSEYLESLAYTLGVRRTHHDFRAFATASSLEDLSKQLSKGLGLPVLSRKQDNNITMVFTGQGAQWPAMGTQLLEHSVFHESVLASQQYLDSFGCPWNAIEELTKTGDSLIGLPEYSQTLCTVLQVALVDVLRSWDIKPIATIGHSSGEIAAAYAALYLTHHDAVKLAYVRGISSSSVPKRGAMMAAGLSPVDAEQYLTQVPFESAVIACVNSPTSVTISGDVEAIDKLEQIISGEGKFARKLKVNTAYHSPHMRAVQDSYLKLIGDLTPQDLSSSTPRPAMFSSLLGRMINEPAELNAQYWVQNMVQSVQFSDAMTALLKHSLPAEGKARPKPIKFGAFIEVGPHAALQGPVGQIITAAKDKVAKEAPYMSMLLRGQDASVTSLAVAGKLWSYGHKVDFAAVNGHASKAEEAPTALIDLPSYPWNHSKSFWHEAMITRSNRFPPSARTDLLGQAEDLQNSFEPRWRNHLRITENPWIEDHKITDTTLYPGAGLLIMAIEGALRTADTSKTLQGFRFTDINFDRGLVVPGSDEPAVETRLSLYPHSSKSDSWQFTIYSMSTGQTAWTRHCFGTISLEYSPEITGDTEVTEQDAVWAEQLEFHQKLLAAKAAEEVDVVELYEHLDTIGMQYGPLFRNVVSLHAVPEHDASYGDIVVPDTKSVMPAEHEPEHIIHPATMDAIFHIVLAAFNGGRPITQAAVPYSIEEMYVATNQPKGAGTLYKGYGRLTSKSEDGHEVTGDLVVSDDTWALPKLTVKNFALREVSSGTSSNEGVALDVEEDKKCAAIEWRADESFIRGAVEGSSLPEKVILLRPAESLPSVRQFIDSIAAAFVAAGVTIRDATLSTESLTEVKDSFVVALLEIDQPLIYSWTEDQFAAFKTLMVEAKHMLWVTRGGVMQSWSSGPEFAPAQGLLRVMRNEYPMASLPHLDLSTAFELTGAASSELLLNVWRNSLPEGAEMEFAEEDGSIYVPRAVDDTGFDYELNLASGKSKPVYKPLGASVEPQKPAKVVSGRDSLWVADDVFSADLEADEIDIEVNYAGIEPSNSAVLARQAVGAVVRCGSNVSGLRTGQRVVLLAENTLKTHVRQHKSLVAPVPRDMAPEAAAALFTPLVAANYALNAASLIGGQQILVHNAASSIGQATVQLAQARGAEVFALYNTSAEASILQNAYGLAEDHIFNAKLRNFVVPINAATNDNGVDVVFCAEPSSVVDLSLDVFSRFGRFVDLTGGAIIQSLPLSKRNATLLRIDMDDIYSSSPDLVQSVFQSCVSNVNIKPILPVYEYGADELGKTVAHTESNNGGSVVVSLNKDAKILGAPSPAPALQLDAAATYILAGGLGALGLDIADWMVSHGAKHLVFLSRSGGAKNEKDLQSLRDRGCDADAFKCDVTVAQTVAEVFHQLREAGRTIRGVVQCAMVLEDTIFDNMSHGQWNRAFNPKTRGSRNLLANLWPGDSPFLILLSSITGVIGNTAQANYASGNTFEDALAHHARSHLGISATSLDVGLVDDASHFSEAGAFGDLDQYLGKYGHGWHGLRTNLDELRVAMQAIIRGSTADGQAIPAQMVLGLGDNLILQEGATGFQADKKFALRVVKVEETDATGGKKESIAVRLAKAESLDDATAVVEESIKQVVAQAIGVGMEEVDSSKPLFDYGVDSLKAVEIRNKVMKDMQSNVSVFELLSASPLSEVAAKIASKSTLVKVDAGVE